MINNWLVCLVVLGLASGCSSAPKYPNTHPKNVTINMKLGEGDQGGLFTSVDVAVGVNDIVNKCETSYQGYVDLKQGENKLGLAPGKPTYVMIEIARNSYGSGGSFGRGTVLTPKQGAQYVIDFNYVDSMFDFSLYELKKNKKIELPLIPLPACK
ncbi:MAG: hypothetical protein HYZ31_09760 [Gammaproteobacteria bacterium]|nr:hypothetical protein [Gammaproteobacteria bacterium]